MSVALVNTGNALAGSGANLSVPVPSGTVAGDVLIIVIIVQSPSHVPATPTGLTLLDSYSAGPSAASYIRACDGTEPGSYTFTTSGFAAASCGVARTYSGASGTPHAHSAWNLVSSSATTIATGFTTTVDGCELVFASGVVHAEAAFTNPSGFANQAGSFSGTQGISVISCDQSQTTHGATGNESGTWQFAGNSVATLIALAPSGGGSTVSVSWATTGTSAPAFSPTQTDKITLAATSAATPAFSLKQTDKVLLAATGHAAPVFSLKQIDPLAVATHGVSAPSFGLKQTDSVVASTIGRSNPAFLVSGGAPTVRPDTHLSVAINKLRVH